MPDLAEIIKASPYAMEDVIGMGVDVLARELGADEVVFKEVENGITIGIVCDEEGKDRAKEFWSENISEQLGGE